MLLRARKYFFVQHISYPFRKEHGFTEHWVNRDDLGPVMRQAGLASPDDDDVGPERDM